jgi:hypothetical protein
VLFESPGSFALPSGAQDDRHMRVCGWEIFLALKKQEVIWAPKSSGADPSHSAAHPRLADETFGMARSEGHEGLWIPELSLRN